MNTRVIVSTLASLLVTASAADAATARYRCYPIGPGETAAELAGRLTGDQVNRQAAWFQIFDTRRTLVRKADYNLIQPGWRACLTEAHVRLRTPAAVGTAGPERQVPQTFRERVTPVQGDTSIVDPVFLWWLAWTAAAAISIAASAASWG